VIYLYRVTPLKAIDLLPFQSYLRYQKEKNGLSQIFDPIRKKFLITTPEEVVRQLWIGYFMEFLRVSSKLMAIERGFTINEMTRRFDMVIFSKTTQPILLAEFKAPAVKLTQAVFDQIAQYNMALHIPYSLVSNGVEHYCFQIDDVKKEFVWMKDIPSLS